MGTISDKLMRIINTKEDIRRALISKGYDVPTSIPFKEYAKMILDLPCNADSFPDIEGIVARYSALGLTNEQMAENPVWKDLTGNGHDLQMKNFAWKGMSGVGGYGDENYQTFYKFTLDDYLFIASPPGVKHMNFTFRVTGLQPGNKLTLAFLEQRILSTVHGTKMAYILLMLILLRQGNQHTFITDMAQPEESLRLKFFLSTQALSSVTE